MAMKNLFSYRDDGFENIFKKILSSDEFKPYMNEIIDAIIRDELDREELNRILKDYDIQGVSFIKMDALNLLLSYARYILDDHVITEMELANLKVLKRIFKIREGDFYNLRRNEIQYILNEQFCGIYKDNKVDHKEAPT